MKHRTKEAAWGHTAIGRFLKNYGGLVIVIIAMIFAARKVACHFKGDSLSIS